jgi:dTDP-4-amino-4,6-dideoxygalactose transaminase
MRDDVPAIAGGRPIRPRERFLVFGAPAFDEADIAAVTDCLRRRWVGTGPMVQKFEGDFATYKRAPYAVAVNSCTAALHLALLALGIGRDDEVITTPMTFCSSLNAIIHAGARPVLADCDRHTMNIRPEAIEARIGPRTKAILVVHMCGRCCEMDAIVALAHRHNLALVEDCAHAIESTWRGKPAGTMGNAGCFSFYVTKNLTTVEGGMVLTSDQRLAERVRTLALHGMTKDAWKRFSDEGYLHYDVVEAGFKHNMTDLQAVLGINQLARIEEKSKRRKEIWETYDRELADLPCFLPQPAEEGTRHAYHLYTPLLDLERLTVSRDQVLKALTLENLGVGVHYTAVHLHPYYRKTYGWKEGDFPDAEYVGARTLSLPLSADLTDEDVSDVVRGFRRILEHYRAPSR